MGDLEINHVINNLRARRDCLALAHASIKAESDQYNKAIIILSLSTGLYEAVKFRFGWNTTLSSLVPIAISSVVAGISSLIRYKHFPELISNVVQAESLLTACLTNCRNRQKITPEILLQYNDALQSLEVSLYPNVRAKFLKISQQNILSIMQEEAKYFNLIETLKKTKTKAEPENELVPMAPLVATLPDAVLSALSELTVIPDLKTISPLSNYIVKDDDEPAVELTIQPKTEPKPEPKVETKVEPKAELELDSNV